jgi:hypothetical protein
MVDVKGLEQAVKVFERFATFSQFLGLEAKGTDR